RGPARRRLRLHPAPADRRAPVVHAERVRPVESLPDLLRRVPLPRGLAAVHRPGLGPPAVLRPAPHARGAGRGHRPARAHHDLARVDPALRPPPEDRALDAPDLALRLPHRRRHLLDALSLVTPSDAVTPRPV